MKWEIGKPGFSLAWELCQEMMEFKSRYAWVANPDIPLCDLASLNWVSHRVPSSPALNYMQHLLAWQQTIVGTIPCARRVRTHTHILSTEKTQTTR